MIKDKDVDILLQASKLEGFMDIVLSSIVDAGQHTEFLIVLDVYDTKPRSHNNRYTLDINNLNINTIFPENKFYTALNLCNGSNQLNADKIIKNCEQLILKDKLEKELVNKKISKKTGKI